MTAAIALIAALATYLLVAQSSPAPLADRLACYLRPARYSARTNRHASQQRRLLDRAPERLFHRTAAALAGALIGLLLAQGDLFLSGPSVVSSPLLAVVGGIAGSLVYNMVLTTRRQQRARRIRFELPVVADAIALHVIAGESVATSLDRFVATSHGVASEELTAVLDRHRAGAGLTESLDQAAKTSAASESGRLYSLLGQAHVTGGRLTDALAELATDYRAALGRDMTTEGGKRALAGYGPILALMVPVALVFLLHPTLVGLRELAGP